MRQRLITIGITLAFLFGGLIFALVCLDEVNSTSLITYHDENVFASYTPEPLTPERSIRGEFQARYDNLGMVKFRIRTFHRMNTSHIRLQIREKGASDWWATNTYALDRFGDGLLYPFGFPVIPDSKGKTYEFLVESVDGDRGNAIGIAPGYHNAATQYVYKKSGIVSGLGNMMWFFSEKIKNSLSDPYTMLYISMFLVPAVLYTIKRAYQPLIIYMFLIYTYIPLSLHANTALVLAAFVAGIWLWTRRTASGLYIMALLWIFQIPFLIAFGHVLAADRAATLIFFLLCISGMISLWHSL